MRYKVYTQSILLVLLLIFALPTTAQTDEPLVAGINYGMSVQETITDYAFFDWWQLDVEVDDVIVVSMEAAEGLQPLLGLLNADGTLVTRSDLEVVAEVDGVAFMQHKAITAGQYTIIASRDGRDVGTTTGTYLLTVNNRSDNVPSRPNPFLETEFRCDEWLLTNALTFQFSEDVNRPDQVVPGQVTEFYRISVYGLDEFEPVIRIQSNILLDRPLDCTDSAQATEGSRLDFPFLDEAYEVTTESADHVAMVTITNSGDGEPLGDVTINIGSKDNTSGRFIVVLEGLKIREREDEDEIRVRRGPFASETELDVYMIGNTDNRLDPYLEAYKDETDSTLFCDDIGRNDCSDLSEIDGASIVISDSDTTYSADRFDTGLHLDSSDNYVSTVTFKSRENATFGDYIVVFVGELPPRG